MVPLRPMRLSDYDRVMRLLRDTPGVCLREADSRAAIARYLDRNPGLSLVAEIAGEIVGCVLAGHDGRRGFLYHLAVAPAYRRRGLGRALVAACVSALRSQGIRKMHIDVLAGNADGMAFWERLGWQSRDDLCRFSFTATCEENA
ncbi:MAG: GNAT family N-acetyltransferase [Betaproteobacteria bacterium]|nr:GNAT family N-acetyltransferase [Betaproteobacteria bacterium]